MNICFDLDGPIIDVLDRYYRAYLGSLTDTNINKEQILSKENFWKLKQNRISDLEIGILSGLTINEAKKSAEIRKALTFKEEYFEVDKLFSDVNETFNFLKSKSIDYFVVTLRRKKQVSLAVKKFKLNKYLTDGEIFSLEDDHKILDDTQEKYLMLLNAINRLGINPLDTWLIGDSDTDIHAGRLAKYGKVIAISRGIRSKEQLELLKPDYLISSLSEILNLVALYKRHCEEGL